MKTLILATMVLTGVGTGVLASGEARAKAGPRLYTNDDLDRLGPAPASPSRPVSGADDAGWDYVERFIDTEHNRLVTDRALDMEERRRAIEDDALQAFNDRRTFVGNAYGDWNSGWPYAGAYAGIPYAYGVRGFHGSGWGHNRRPGMSGPKANARPMGPQGTRNPRTRSPRAR